MGDAVDGDTIYNGAIDNATGSAALLEIAAAFASLPVALERSVVFIATTAEEQGLLGATYYADHPLFPLTRTAGVINVDALFPFDDFKAVTVTGFGSSELEEYLGRAAAKHGRKLQPDPQPEAGAFLRSDHYPFGRKGVPAIFAVGGPPMDEPLADELVERYTNYMAGGYHKPADEYDAATWDMRGIVGDARIFFDTGLELANDERFPNWRLDHEFRRLRDRMLAGIAVDDPR